MTDGWGLASFDGSTLIGSDGTSRLYFMRPGIRFKCECFELSEMDATEEL